MSNSFYTNELTVSNPNGTVAMGYDGSKARALNVTNNGTLIIGDGGSSITVDGTVTANLSATDNAVLDTIDSKLHKISKSLYNHTLNVSDPNGTVAMGYDGSVVRALKVTNDGTLIIGDGGSSITVDGTVTANLSATDNAVLDTIDSKLHKISKKSL